MTCDSKVCHGKPCKFPALPWETYLKLYGTFKYVYAESTGLNLALCSIFSMIVQRKRRRSHSLIWKPVSMVESPGI